MTKPKKVKKTPKKLIGERVVEGNYLIGATVVADISMWQFGAQGEECSGQILEFIETREAYGLLYNYVKVLWSNQSCFSYPLDGCLVFSDGVIVKSKAAVFKETYQDWDIVKVVRSEMDTFEKNEELIVVDLSEFKVFSTRTVTELYMDKKDFEKVDFEKVDDKDEQINDLIKLFADEVETPSTDKEEIIRCVKESMMQKMGRFFYIHLCYKNENRNSYLRSLSQVFKIRSKDRFIIVTKCFGEVSISWSVSMVYKLSDGMLSEFLYKNFGIPKVSKPYKKVVEILKSFEDCVVFSEKLQNVVSTANCSDALKNYFNEVKQKMDENFIDFNRSTKKIVFTPKGKNIKINGDYTFGGVRQEVSPHKFFNKYFKDSGLSEYDIKCFTDEVIASYGEYRMVEIEDGKIGKFYTQLTQEGWAVGSCMRNKPLHIFSLYDNHPHIFKMLAIMLNGELVGRALKVNAKLGEDGSDFTYVDRLYYKNEEVVAWFESYCAANNLTRKNKNSVDSYRTFYNNKDGKFIADIYIDIANHLGKQLQEVEKFSPYLDTLGCASDGFIYNYEKFPIKGHILYGISNPQHSLRVQDGEYTGKEFKGYCFLHQRWVTNPVKKITCGRTLVGKTVVASHTIETEEGISVK